MRILLFIACLALGAASSASAAAPEIGDYQWGAGGSGAHVGPNGVNYFARWTGGPIALGNDITDYTQGWDNMQAPSWQYGPWQTWLKAKPGRNLVIGYPILPGVDASRTLPDGTTVSWQQCAAGAYNAYYAKFAQGLMNYGADSIYIRLAWEFDGNWYAWQVENGEEKAFVACWRDVVDTMRAAAPGNNFKFVWNADTYYYTDRGGMPWLQTTYPGNRYVDVVAIELYDNTWDANAYPFPAGCNSSCKQQHRQYAWSNDLMPATQALLAFAQTNKKPFAFGEWGVDSTQDWVNGAPVNHGGLDDPGYIQNMYNFIENPANNVAFASYFDISTNDGNHEVSPADGPTKFPVSAARYQKLFATATGAPTIGGSSGISTIPVPATGTTSFNVTTPAVVVGFVYDSTNDDWGNMQPHAFLQYDLYAAAAGTYQFVLSEATPNPNAAARLTINGALAARMAMPNTGSWMTPQNVTVATVTLPAGRSTLRVTDTAGQSYNIFGLSLTPLSVSQ